MKELNKNIYELDDSELNNIAGGAAEESMPPHFPIGTKVLETEFQEAVGQDRGEVIAYGWPEGGKYSYIIRWNIHGEKKYSEDRVAQLRMCWELTYE